MQKISSYIIFTRSVEDITVQVEKLYARSSWESRGLFSVVVTVKVAKSEELALSVIRELWEIGRGYNVVVVVQQDDLLNLYTWFPYSSHDNCNDVKNVILINQWVMEEERKFVREGSLYIYKFPSTVHGCTVNLSPYMKGGIEDEIYNQYFLTHNITPYYAKDFLDISSDFDKISACMHNLWARRSEMAFGSLPLLEEEVSNQNLPYHISP
jgi:hypothetical protein